MMCMMSVVLQWFVDPFLYLGVLSLSGVMSCMPSWSKMALIHARSVLQQKKHAEKDAEFLDGLFLRVTKVITKESVAVEDRRRMYQNYGSAQAIIITKRKALNESSK